MNAGRRLVTCAVLGSALATGGSAFAAGPSKAACAAANEMSQSFVANGRLLDAREQLVSCANKACPRLVRADCVERLASVERAIPSIVFQVVDGAGHDVTGVQASDNGEALEAPLDGKPLTFDPGDHLFRFEAIGLPVIEKHFVIVEGVKNRVERVVLAPPPPPPAPPPPPPPPPEPPSRVPAIAVVGAGALQLGVGAVLLGLSASQYSQLEGQGCSPTCNPSSWKPWRASNIAGDVLLATGGATAVAGAVWWIMLARGSSAPSVGLAPSPGGGGALVRGSF